ncbi:unnamed protein product [Phytophthora lilii]|uniref:Unnamed protein product n=1 Tax=Phytophthora lilii TaxID=2077276 RepID=A0A9W6X5M9_9STRA|nr:unnamed protein product [Phytophthora lilii]
MLAIASSDLWDPRFIGGESREGTIISHVVHGDLTDELLAKTAETNVETMAQYYATADNDTNLDVTALIGNADTCKYGDQWTLFTE